MALAGYTDAELGSFYHATADDMSEPLEAWRRTIEAELDRRDLADRAAKAARSRPGLRDTERGEWACAAHAQFLRAEAECRGELLNRRGTDAGVDPWSLWSGPEHRVDLYASEELREFFRRERRITVTEYQRQAAAGRREERETRHDRLADHDAGPVRHRPEAGTARTVPGTRPSGHAGPARSAHRRPGVRVSDMLADLHGRAAALHTPPAAASTPTTTVAVREPGTVSQRAELDGARVLGYARQLLTRYARFPSAAAADVATLWAAHTHARDSDGVLTWQATPRLMMLSSEPGSGKSRVLELLGWLCPATFGLDTEPTAAGLTWTLNAEHATVLLDEADLLFGAGKRRESIRAILNAGYARNGTVLRMRGARGERQRVFGPVALGGLDVLATSTGESLLPLFSRSIVIPMRRAAEAVPALDSDGMNAAAKIRTALALWTGTVRDAMAQARPELPDWLMNRPAEIWTPLLAVADAAGDDWPDRARLAAEELAFHDASAVEIHDDSDLMGDLAGITAGW